MLVEVAGAGTRQSISKKGGIFYKIDFYVILWYTVKHKSNEDKSRGDEKTMNIQIGALHIGYRSHDKRRWKKYLIPKAYCKDKRYKHSYFKFYYRWLNFFWCMPRKCECCGQYMTSPGGTHIYDINGNNILKTICKNCKDTKEYVDNHGTIYKGYAAWLQELW